MKKKNNIFLLIIPLIIILIVVSFIQLTTFNFSDNQFVRHETKINSQLQTESFSFDDYVVKITATNKQRLKAGCDNTDNWNGICDERFEYISEDGCNIYSAARLYKVCKEGCYHTSTDDRYYPSYESGKCYCGGGKWRSYETKFCDVDDRRYTKGREFGSPQQGHFYKLDLFYKGSLIAQTSGDSQDGLTKEISQYYLTTDGEITNGIEPDTFYYLYYGSKSKVNYKPYGISGKLFIEIQENQFDINTILPEDIIYDGEKSNVIINIDYKGHKSLLADMIINYTVDTTVGSASKTVLKNINIQQGLNEYVIEVPSEQPNFININTQLKLYYSTGSFSGFQVMPGKLFLGVIELTPQSIDIRPSAEKELIILNKTLLDQTEQLEEARRLVKENLNNLKQQNKTIQEQLEIIKNQKLTVEENTLYIVELQNQYGFQQSIIENLTKDREELKIYVAQLLILIDDDKTKVRELLNELDINNEEALDILEKYSLILDNDRQYANQLNVSLDIIDETLQKYQQNLISLQEAVNILNIKNEDLKILIDEYENRNRKLVIIIDELSAKNNELLKQLEKPYIKSNDYVWYIILTTIIITLILFIKTKRKR